MAEVDCEIDLVMFWNFKDVFLILHVHCDKFVADFRRVFSIIDQTELFGLNIKLQDRIIFKPNSFTFDLFTPSVFVEAFSEENDVGQYSLVVHLVDSVAHSI